MHIPSPQFGWLINGATEGCPYEVEGAELPWIDAFTRNLSG